MVPKLNEGPKFKMASKASNKFNVGPKKTASKWAKAVYVPHACLPLGWTFYDNGGWKRKVCERLNSHLPFQRRARFSFATLEANLSRIGGTLCKVHSLWLCWQWLK